MDDFLDAIEIPGIKPVKRKGEPRPKRAPAAPEPADAPEVVVKRADIAPRIHKTTVIDGAHGTPLAVPDVDLNEIEVMACIGLTTAQMADSLGIPAPQFGKLAKNDPYVADAIERGKARGVKMVADALFQNALKGNVAAQIFTMKARAGWTDKTEVDLKTTHEVKMDFQSAVELLKQAGIDPEKL